MEQQKDPATKSQTEDSHRSNNETVDPEAAPNPPGSSDSKSNSTVGGKEKKKLGAKCFGDGIFPFSVLAKKRKKKRQEPSTEDLPGEGLEDPSVANSDAVR